MKLAAPAAFVIVLVIVALPASTTYRSVLAQGAPTIAKMHVHHVHLNAVNPKAAAAYYPKIEIVEAE
jgi:hypothetical protein